MAKQKRYSYIKNPYSTGGWYCFVLGIISFILSALVIVSSVRTNGEVSLFFAAVGLSAIMLDICGLIFLINCLMEKDRNHIFAFIGGVLELIVLLAWVFVLAVR
ncbi:MAG: hypothetical protein Q4E57_07920 [Eubacteriales bacterium]|nr:hypothetical protein [Eubacteriales bacterium]